ncbi:Frizzled-1 [Intoshia linei]|uniref:Frizzled-1 n=1 Tax=Intoshia linei TaxID=1819745 RepID=A0A177B8U5_9BILA|nr:Frizzled-1 [Intoshia linei]
MMFSNICILLTFLSLTLSSRSNQHTVIREDNEKCEDLTVRTCKDMPYNRTLFPNFLDQTTQMAAENELSLYRVAIESECSKHIKKFLCLIYVPVCAASGKPVKPCRSFCEKVKKDCRVLADAAEFKWPPVLRCDKFPESEMCVPNSIDDTYQNYDFPNTDVTTDYEKTYNPELFRLQCPNHLLVENFDYELKVDNIVFKSCGMACVSFFSEKQQKFAWYWIGIWSTLCVVSSLFTLITFMLDTSRFRYPERPIVYLCSCYIFVGIAYVVGFAVGKGISCIDLENELDIRSSVIVQGTKREACTIIFMLSYYFSMASSIWWVILSLTWFLSAYLKWGHEAIEAHSRYFHLVAWAIPAIQTIAILAMGKVEGDVLSGTCFTGIHDMGAKNAFVLIPLVIYLAIGTSFLVAGFISLVRIRSFVRGRGTSIDKLEKLIVRIGIFSVLYTVPATIVIACQFYTQQHHEQWMLAWVANLCQKYEIENCPIIKPESTAHPDFTVFMVQYLMMLIVGVTSSCWLWSNKTIKSWRFIYCSFGTKSNEFVA